MLPEMIIDTLLSTVSQGIEQAFADYVKGHNTSRWMLFSDYVLNQRDRPNDVFAFTLVPGGQHLNTLLAEFSATATHDFKKIHEVSDSMARLLTDKRLVTFCFVVNPARVITCGVQALRGMLDDTLAMMEKWEDADGHRELIKKFKAMRQKAESRSFNIRLLGDIIVATTLAAFLTYLVCNIPKSNALGGSQIGTISRQLISASRIFFTVSTYLHVASV